MTTTPSAQWIWCSGEPQPKNFYLHARRSFECSTPVRHAEIAVTADSRYHLFVNGVRVAAGPARSDRRWQCLDQWDITHLLRPGRNVIAALVHHYGEWTFSYMLGRGGFFADVSISYDDGRSERIGTDAGWRVRAAEAWDRRMPRISIQLGFAEIFDARKEFEGWTLPEFDDSHWHQAVVLGPAGMEPWPRLVPRDIPAMTEIPVQAVRVLDTGCVGTPPTGHYADLHRIAWCAAHGVAYLGTFIWSPDERSMEIHAGSQESLKVWLNDTQVISTCGKRDPAPDQDVAAVRLHKGWNTVLAKVVQDDLQWHFLFRLHGEGSDLCRYSRLRTDRPPEPDEVDPWWFLGPFPAASMQAGFDTRYQPEIQWTPETPVTRDDGTQLRWISAGVTRESQIPAIIMSREPRLSPATPHIVNPAGIISGSEGAEFLPGMGDGTYVVIDFGKEVTGFPLLDIAGAAGGEIIDIGYSEFLTGPGGSILSPAEGAVGIVNCDRHCVHYADRYICRPGGQQFRTFDKRAFRYVQIDVRGLKQPIRIGPVTLLLSTYPVEYRGHFECSEDLLNRIWEVGRWTVQLNMEDAYTDCPWRERGQWWGDARVQALVNYYTFGDLALIRYGLRTMAHSQDAEGWTRGIYPTDWSYAILPTFSLLWIISLYDYMLFSGDRDVPRDCLPQAEAVLAACERYRSKHGLLRDMPYWLFVDWSGVDSGGESASVNALYHGALRAASAIAGAVGRPDIARRYDTIAEAVRAGMKRILWDEEKKAFRESWRAGELSKEISEQANCWAVAFGVVDKDVAPVLMKAITQEKQASVLIGTPYFSFYMLDALGLSGNHRQALAYIRERWTSMLDWGATTWWENWHLNGSLCHGWSAGPTSFLQSEILGIKPGQPGWDEIIIEPQPAGLSWIRGTVPTPHGPVSVECRSEKEFSLRVDVPRPAHVRLPDGAPERVEVRRAGDSVLCDFECQLDAHGNRSIIIPEAEAYVITGR